MELLKLGEKLVPGHFGRREVAHDDVRDERGPDRVGGARGGDDRARELKHRPKKVARELVVVDHQHVNPVEFRNSPTAHGPSFGPRRPPLATHTPRHATTAVKPKTKSVAPRLLKLGDRESR
jgi:hypothetical protein